jgi:hypothetical protein
MLSQKISGKASVPKEQLVRPATAHRAQTEEAKVERWPLSGSALLIVATSGLLWAMIISAVRWLTD